MKTGLAARAKEEKELEEKISDWAEHYGRRVEIGRASNEVASEKNQIFQAAQDDFMFLWDTSRMDPQVKKVFLMAQKETMVRIVTRCRVAQEKAIAVAEAAESARIAAETAAMRELEVEDEDKEGDEETIAEVEVETAETENFEETDENEEEAMEGADGGDTRNVGDSDSDRTVFDNGDWCTEGLGTHTT